MQDNKEKLLDELASTFAMLKASPLHGVGVFAIRPIQKDETKIFSSEVLNFSPEIQALIENYCLFDEKGYFVPAHGFKSIDLSLCLNHSDDPNLRSIEDGAYFIAIRDIFPGEELTVDYGTICDSKE